MIKPEEKPFVVAETGAVNNCHSGPFKYYLCDDRGIIFVDCVYTPVFLESATCGNIWHWDGRYVEAKNLYKYYKPLAQLTQNIDFQNEEFESLDFSDGDVYLLILKGKTCSIGFVRNKNDSWKNVLRDGNEPVAVKVKVIEFKNKNVKKIDIWEDDTTKIESDLNNLKFSDILYGSVFYIEN